MHARRYVMTSGATMAKTAQFFKDNNFFGIKQEDVFIFSQFQIPSLTTDGKLILNAKNGIALNPDGNGGLYRALKERGALDDMAKRGIEHVHVYCVDNVLVKVANPTFIGFCIEQGVHAGALVVPKQQPHEKVCLLVFVCMCFVASITQPLSPALPTAAPPPLLLPADGSLADLRVSVALRSWQRQTS